MLLNKLVSPALLLALAAGTAAQGECSELSEAQCCYDAYVQFWKASTAAQGATPTLRNYTVSWIRETRTDVPTTTLCDGFLRYLETRPVDTSYLTVAVDEPVTEWIDLHPPNTISRPSCHINEDDCARLSEEFRSSPMTTDSSTPVRYPPPCATYSPCPTDDEVGNCKLFLDASTVYYWPVTMEGDLCGQRTTVTHPEPTRSTVLSGHTFVSPSMYVSVDYLSADNMTGRFEGTACGRGTGDFYLTINPTDASTHSGKLSRNHQTFDQINLADMNEPTPVTAYFNLLEAPDCETAPENCTEPIEASRTPILSVPVQMLRDADPEFQFCDLWPSSRTMIQWMTWVPLEPTQDGWPKATADPGRKEEDEEEEEEAENEEAVGGDVSSVTQVVSVTQTIQDPKKL